MAERPIINSWSAMTLSYGGKMLENVYNVMKLTTPPAIVKPAFLWVTRWRSIGNTAGYSAWGSLQNIDVTSGSHFMYPFTNNLTSTDHALAQYSLKQITDNQTGGTGQYTVLLMKYGSKYMLVDGDGQWGNAATKLLDPATMTWVPVSQTSSVPSWEVQFYQVGVGETETGIYTSGGISSWMVQSTIVSDGVYYLKNSASQCLFADLHWGDCGAGAYKTGTDNSNIWTVESGQIWAWKYDTWNPSQVMLYFDADALQIKVTDRACIRSPPKPACKVTKIPGSATNNLTLMASTKAGERGPGSSASPPMIAFDLTRGVKKSPVWLAFDINTWQPIKVSSGTASSPTSALSTVQLHDVTVGAPNQANCQVLNDKNAVAFNVQGSPCSTWCRDMTPPFGGDCSAGAIHFCQAYPQHPSCACIEFAGTPAYNQVKKALGGTIPPWKCWAEVCTGDNPTSSYRSLITEQMNTDAGANCVTTINICNEVIKAITMKGNVIVSEVNFNAVCGKTGDKYPSNTGPAHGTPPSGTTPSGTPPSHTTPPSGTTPSGTPPSHTTPPSGPTPSHSTPPSGGSSNHTLAVILAVTIPLGLLLLALAIRRYRANKTS